MEIDEKILSKLIEADDIKYSLYVDGKEYHLEQVNIAKSSIEMLASDDQSRKDMVTKHWIEWNRKFALSAACIVLFMIGAPLGSIIRKGGLGTPLIFAIAFFVLFNMLNTFGEKFAGQQIRRRRTSADIRRTTGPLKTKSLSICSCMPTTGIW